MKAHRRRGVAQLNSLTPVLRPSLLGIACGLLVGAIACFVVLVTAAAGHGTYLPAALLFPFTMGLATLAGRINPALVAIALAQFPLYGLLAGRWGFSKWTFRLAGVHLLAMVLAVIAVSNSEIF